MCLKNVEKHWTSDIFHIQLEYISWISIPNSGYSANFSRFVSRVSNLHFAIKLVQIPPDLPVEPWPDCAIPNAFVDLLCVEPDWAGDDLWMWRMTRNAMRESQASKATATAENGKSESVGEGNESCHKACKPLGAQPTSEWCGMWCTALWQLTPKLIPPINAKSLYQLPFQQSVAYFPAAFHRYSLVERRNVCTRQTLLR